MANKKKTVPSDRSVQALSRQASVCMRSKKYRQAIELYKTILKLEPKLKWKNRLAEAYRGRIEELVRKKMYKEAQMILDNMMTTCEKNASPGLQALIALASHDFESVISFFKKPINVEPDFDEHFGNLIASQILTASDSEIRKAPALQEFLVQHQAILTAFQALANGADESCQNSLNAIPFRSIYKDFRLFIKALQSYYQKDLTTAMACFSKIPLTSTLKKLAQTAEKLITRQLFSTESTSPTLPTPQELAFAIALAGKKMVPSTFIEIFKKSFLESSKLEWFYLIKGNKKAFDQTLLKNLCHRTLYLDPLAAQQYVNMWGPLSPFEFSRLQALYLEHVESRDLANNHWIECIEILDKSPFETDTEKNLARAMLLRRIAQNKQLYDVKSATNHRWYDDDDDDFDWDDEWNDDWDDVMGTGEPELARSTWQNDLEKSLEYDPTDKKSFEVLLDYYQKSNNKKLYRQWLERYLTQFPADIAQLSAAIDQATDRKAYNIALNYVEQILKLDPMNKVIKEKKIYILITKARKYIEKRKYSQARTAFRQAASVFDGTDGDGTVFIKWGFFEYLAGDNDEGERLTQQGLEMLGAGIRGPLVAYFESKRMKLPAQLVKKYQELFKIKIGEPATVPNVFALIQTLFQYREIEFFGKAVDTNQAFTYLKKAVTCDYDLNSLKEICEYFYIFKEYQLLKSFAEAGLVKYPNNPAMIFLWMIGKSTNQAYKLTHQDLKKLKKAEMMAQQAGDQKTVRNIQNFMAQPGNPFLPQNHPHLPVLDEDFDNFMDNIDPDLLSEILNDILGQNRRKNRAGSRKANPLPRPKKNPQKPDKPIDPNQTTLF